MKVLYVDNRKVEFKKLQEVFTNTEFELIPSNTPAEESATSYIPREKQYDTILKQIRENEYEVILFDLTLRERTENNLKLGTAAKNFLSIELYTKEKQWLKTQGKKFIFVTSHESWSRTKFCDIEGINSDDDLFLEKVEDNLEDKYVACPKLIQGKPMCGAQFEYCKHGECFIKCLRRIVK